MGVVRHLESVATYPELRAAFNAVQPEVSAFYTGIPLNAGLWSNIKSLRRDSRGRAARPARAAAFCTRPSTPSAATAPTFRPEGKKRLEEIDVELTKITTKFSRERSRFDQRLRTGDHRRSRAGRIAADARSPARARARSARDWKAGASPCRRPTTWR